MADGPRPRSSGERYPARTIAAILLDAEQKAGDRPALYVQDDILTFGEVAVSARHLAGHLATRGVRRGHRVALLLPNGAAFVTAHYAVALLGAVIVPISPQMKGDVVGHILAKSAAVGVIGTEHLLGDLQDRSSAPPVPLWVIALREEGRRVFVRLDGGAADGRLAPLEQLPPYLQDPASAAGDPAVLFFTSGTTGTPKGVLLRQEQVLFGVDAWARRWSFDERTISLMAAPYFHVVYNPLVLGAHRCCGATVVQTNLTVRAVTAAIERYRVTALMGTPAFMQQLATDRWATRYDMSSLAALIYGAAPTPPDVVRLLGRYFPRAARYNCYGMTETSSALTCLAEPDVAGREASVGRPHPGVVLQVMDPAGRALPPGDVGEVCARGPNVIAGYFDAPDVDAARFYDAWLRTGDVGYLDAEGYLYLLDRLDDQINIAGEKFYPSEIENVLLADPSVQEAAAVGVPDALKGRVVYAFVVPAPDREVDVEALRRRCLAQLPACAVPRRVAVLGQLPRNPTGKLLRRELTALVAS
jgi:long-chain acyl-CoA synthetase